MVVKWLGPAGPRWITIIYGKVNIKLYQQIVKKNVRTCVHEIKLEVEILWKDLKRAESHQQFYSELRQFF